MEELILNRIKKEKEMIVFPRDEYEYVMNENNNNELDTERILKEKEYVLEYNLLYKKYQELKQVEKIENKEKEYEEIEKEIEIYENKFKILKDLFK